MRKLFLGIFVVALSITLFGCDAFVNNRPLSDYEKWRNSDAAEDLNGDRKINEEDYEIYLNPPVSDYEKWRNSDAAEDLNGDRKINEEDYEIYLNPPQSAYEIWKNSNEAKDLNNDGKIDEKDYEIFLAGYEFAGSYYITNYLYEGKRSEIFGSSLRLEDFGQQLDTITFVIDNDGKITANIPSSTIASFGEVFVIVLEAFDNMTITRLSKFLVVLDTNVTIENVNVNVTLYLTEIENGFTTTYVINYNNLISIITFDIIKE